MTVGGFIVLAFVWLVSSCVVLDAVSKIDPLERHWTKRLSVRVLMVLGGPVTLVLVVCGFAAAFAVLWPLVRIPEMVRAAFAPTPR